MVVIFLSTISRGQQFFAYTFGKIELEQNNNIKKPQHVSPNGYKNIHQVPVIEKVVINSGTDAANDKTWVGEVAKDIEKIAGQKPVITKARKSISNFKVRQGMPLGVKVTMRGNVMYEFLMRFIAVALPGVRDFRGTANKLDGSGNYTIGITDHSIFPEITSDSNRKTIGMDVTIVTSAGNDKEAKALLMLLGMPFRKISSPSE